MFGQNGKNPSYLRIDLTPYNKFGVNKSAIFVTL